jgi:N-methylhydantoinase B
MNALSPAPVDIRAMVTHLLPDHVMGTLADIAPDLVTSGNGLRWMLLADHKRSETGKRSITSFFQAGALGASTHGDGPNAKFWPIKAYHTPIERFELDTGLIVEEKSLRADSGGPGQYRGGLGQRIRLWNPSNESVSFTFYRPQMHHPPAGYFGGHPGSTGRIEVNGKPLTKGVMRLEPGDRVLLETPCGAGVGAPRLRDPEAVRCDVRQGYVSAASASEIYRVALHEDGEIAQAQTALLRDQVASQEESSVSVDNQMS